MITTETWWESIFSGPLALGINREKIQLLESEGFLYLQNQQSYELENDENSGL